MFRFGDLAVKNVISAILCVVLGVLLGAQNQEILSNASLPVILENLEALTSLFLFGIAAFLLVGAGSSSKTEVPNSDTNESPSSNADALQAQHTESSLMYFLSTLQEKGRLLDFVMDDIAPYSDAQVGQVARVVHQGVKEAINDMMEIAPIHSGSEGETISVAEDYNAQNCRLVGNLAAQPPFSGRVLHKGWKATVLRLPVRQDNIVDRRQVVQPMELEVD